jgi:hypothetical protein
LLVFKNLKGLLVWIFVRVLFALNFQWIKCLPSRFVLFFVAEILYSEEELHEVTWLMFMLLKCFWPIQQSTKNIINLSWRYKISYVVINSVVKKCKEILPDILFDSKKK